MQNNEMLLLKLGEVVLKGLNRHTFEDKLVSTVRRRLKNCGSYHIYVRQSTIYVEPQKETCDLEAAYDLWQVTSFSSAEVEMEQALDMFCPQHMVLMPDESGMLCVFHNKYGDAYALVEEMDLPLSELPDSYQEELRPGKGFDTQDELAQWLESIDS